MKVSGMFDQDDLEKSAEVLKLEQVIKIYEDALNKVNDDYEIDWASKERLRAFIRSQKRWTEEALSEGRAILKEST
jgi:hypothetical protein